MIKHNIPETQKHVQEQTELQTQPTQENAGVNTSYKPQGVQGLTKALEKSRPVQGSNIDQYPNTAMPARTSYTQQPIKPVSSSSGYVPILCGVIFCIILLIVICYYSVRKYKDKNMPESQETPTHNNNKYRKPNRKQLQQMVSMLSSSNGPYDNYIQCNKPLTHWVHSTYGNYTGVLVALPSIDDPMDTYFLLGDKHSPAIFKDDHAALQYIHEREQQIYQMTGQHYSSGAIFLILCDGQVATITSQEGKEAQGGKCGNPCE